VGQLLELNTILQIVQELKVQHKRIATTNGCFDIMHAGHLNYLMTASRCTDVLIVGINSDSSVKSIKGPSRPINHEFDRASLVAGLACVDFVFLFDEQTPDTFLTKIKPHIHIKGNDYSETTLPEAKTAHKLGISLNFIELTPGRSTSGMIDRIKTL
jgi:glycerol-3-phosphate cytidylyltransferase